MLPDYTGFTDYTAMSGYTNMGPQWTCNWLSFISDDPDDSTPSELSLFRSGGGYYDYYFSTGETVSQPQATDGSTLTIVASGTAPSYVINYSDGSADYFNVATPTSGPGRIVFMNKTVDRAGNQVLLNYDGNERITTVSGSTGSLSFTYNGDNTIATVQRLEHHHERFRAEHQPGLHLRFADRHHRRCRDGPPALPITSRCSPG